MGYGIQKPLSKENVISKVDSFNIFKKYCEGFEAYGKKFRSPLRSTDKNPSACVIFYEGDLLFKDFGEKSYRAIDFVARLHGLTFREALQKINVDFDLQLKSNMPYVSSGTKVVLYDMPEYIETTNSIIKIKRSEWEHQDIEYWKQYGICRDTLDKFSVRPISHFTINDHLYFSDSLSYSYDYYIEEEIYRRKIYQPYSIYKWFSNGGLIVQGEGMMPKLGDLLIITSSLKDVMCLYELGYTAVAPPSEMVFLPEKYFAKQRERFNKIIIFMDNDETGMRRNIELSKQFGLQYIHTPIMSPYKDISDYRKSNSFEETKQLLYESIQNTNT